MAYTELDIFGDGSGLELVQFEDDLTTALHADMTVPDGNGANLSFSNGRYGRCVNITANYHLNGLSDFHFTGNLNDSATFSFWFKMTTLDGQDLGVMQFADDLFGFLQLYIDSSNNMTVNEGNYDLSGILMAGDLLWHHVVFMWDADADEVSVYLDKVKVLGRTDFTANRSTISDTQGLTVGKGYYVWYGNCMVDQIRFINRAVTTTELGLLFDETESLPLQITYFKDVRSVPSFNQILFFTDTREVLPLQLLSFLDRRTVSPMTESFFEDKRDIYIGESVMFTDRRVVSDSLSYLSFKDIREIESPNSGDTIIRTNT